ncbi:MAG TPA: CDP-glycerol glycerophosphotransferase family protein [Nocardioides sp.]|uniref:bifunctional glycosyltransferase/CDP-glycerol:glycerophosphate glycerophosphotransferase n=1 Tax=Nocardioides sp. TaxID=35761 RepID=UPI002E34AD24|nr:CDP-glycerol glycerophosphotransferase family protein [Nocardioides sp.]HEX3929502.1 CDP-glycerol glycerophosphotransferase family protein [Nocardioides sp.]
MPPARSRAREIGRAALRRVPGRARARLLGSMGGRLGLEGAETGVVTVVVVAEEGDRVEECLASVRGQTHALLDVVVCPVGSAAYGLPDDPRFRAVAGSPTSSDALRAGIEAAGGRYVVPVRGCDQLLPQAVSALAGSLSRSRSNLATGVLEQSGEPERWLAHAQAVTHEAPGWGRPATHLLAGDLSLANKALTRHLARRLARETPPAGGEDWLCSTRLAALLPGLTLDVVDRPVARFAWQRGRRAYGASPSPLPGLGHWLGLQRAVVASVGDDAAFADGWLRHWYDVLLPRFVADAERADDETWRRLVALSAVPAEIPLRAESRGLLALAAADRRADVEALSAELDMLRGDIPTELTEEGPAARWSSVELPVRERLLAESESRLRLRVVRTSASDEGGRAVDLWARIEGIDLAEQPVAVSVTFDGESLPARTSVDATAERWAGARFQSAARGAASVVAPVQAGRLQVSMEVGGVRREADVELPQRPPEVTGDEPEVQSVTLEGELLVVRLDRPADGLRLRGPGTDVLGEPRRDGSVVFDTRRDHYGRQVWLPTAIYHLHGPDGLSATGAWRDSLPVEVVGDRHRLRVLPGGSGDGETTAGELHLGPPRADDELGEHGQEVLRAAYAVDPRRADPQLWYFESFAGRSATDTPLAVYDELVRRGGGVRPAWGILDHGHWAPPGARVVVVGSREWYDVLGTAGVVVTNTEPELWYRRRPDQLMVQCFHGYPSKAMGRSQWEARQLPPRAVARMRRRSVETWDLISTPTPAMTELYREQYGYAGRAAEHGYPRDDALRSADAEEVRATARRRLGVRPDQTAVLYAPTWRDHLASRPRAAAMSEHLDVDAAAAALGEGHVLLVRGHRFHRPGPSRRGVVDVTDHPEVNELILASDVAVLDYSSLRFDYAQTGKPMVFLVPDLADYTAGVRGFLFPFEDTAPGPFVATTGEVVAEVADVGALAAAWSARVGAFDATYNPHQDGHASARLLDAVESALRAR